jgi:hypothetical protein
MHRLFALLLASALLAFAPRADARRVRWQKIEVRKGDDASRVEKRLSRLLKNATKKAKWGKGDTVKLRARLTKLSWEKRDDVLRVSVTVVARIVGGKGARSHIRIGGKPSDRRKLEKQALKIVSDGLITRLSDMARTEAKKREKAKKREEASD